MRYLLCLSLLLAACGGGTDDHKAVPEIRVAAAASLMDVVGKLGDEFTEGKIVGNFGASSDLARQIKDGAPADVYIGASRKWADYMVSEGLTKHPPLTIARNVLVCIAPGDAAGGPDSLAALGGAGFTRIAVGDEGVPVGDYTREALKSAGLRDTLKPALIGQKDARAVLKAVETGEVDCGFVYATDARVAKVRVLFKVDPALHSETGYYGCAVTHAKEPDRARAFVQFLTSPKAAAILREAGFVVPDAD